MEIKKLQENMSGGRDGDRAMWEEAKETMYREAERDKNKDQWVKRSEANEERRQQWRWRSQKG